MALTGLVTRHDMGWAATPAAVSSTNLGMIAHYDSGFWLRNRRRELKAAGKSEHGACSEYWSRTRTLHMSGNGWLDIGYAYFVCPDDKIFEGRGYGHTQAAELPTTGKLTGGNTRYVAVTFGLGPGESPTAGALRAWHRLRAWLVDVKGSREAVHGHRDFTATDCPGNMIYGLVRDGTLKAVTPPAPVPVPTPEPTKEPDMMQYASFGSSAVGATVLQPGEWTPVLFDTEFADPTNVHPSGANPSVLLGAPSAYSLEFGAEVVGADVGTVIDFDAAEYLYDGAQKPPRDVLKESGKPTSAALTDTLTVHHSAVGWCQKGRKLRIRARSHAAGPVKIVNARVSVAFWD